MQINQNKFNKIFYLKLTLARTRSRNLWLKSLTRYPLRHKGIKFYVNIFFFSMYVCSLYVYTFVFSLCKYVCFPFFYVCIFVCFLSLCDYRFKSQSDGTSNGKKKNLCQKTPQRKTVSQTRCPIVQTSYLA